MKIRSVGSLILAVLLLLPLAACRQAEPTPITPTNSETITTTTVATTTTTTTTTNTTTTTSTTTKSTTTTTATTPSTTSKYDPYVVKEGIPSKDKRKFLLNVWGEDVELVYNKTMIHPHINADDERFWYYNGITKKGTPIQCRVNADTGTLAYVEVVDASRGLYNYYRDKIPQEEDVQAVMDKFLGFYNLSSAVEDIHWTRIVGRIANDGTTTVDWRFSCKLTDEGGNIYGQVTSYNKKLRLTKIELSVDATKHPIVIPRWITE